MRRSEMMTAGGVTLAGLGVLVGMALGSHEIAPKLADRTQPVEVRTEVIRKTVNVYRRAKPSHAAGAGAGTNGGGSSGPFAPAVRAATAPTVPARTRASGAAVVPRRAVAAPVSTRSSGGSPGSSSGSGSRRVVSTRSSGGSGGGEHEGGHDD